MKKILPFILLISIILLLEIFFEIKYKNTIILKKAEKMNSFVNLAILETLNKDKNLLPKIASFTFENNNELNFLAIILNKKIIFYNSRKNIYEKIFVQILNTILNNELNFLNHNLNKRKKVLTFVGNFGNFKIIKGFVFDYSFKIIIYIRNLLIGIILIFLIIRFKHKKSMQENIYLESEESSKQIFDYKILYEENKKLAEEIENLTTLREIGIAINSIVDFNQMLNVIMGFIINNLNVEKVIIYFINENGNELLAKIGQERNRIINEEELINEKIIIGNDEIGKAMEYNLPIIINEEDEKILVVPLIAKGNLIGAIKILNKIDGEIFNEQDKEFVRLLSSQISIALNNARLYEMAITDGLTKLYVHRHFQHKLNEEILRSKRNGKHLSLIMLDIDHFKRFNDEYGHQAGDYVLIEIANIIKKMFRATDSAFRYGGEELAIILPETESEDAFMLAEKLRLNIMNHKFNYKNENLSVTVSLGVATYYPYIENLTQEEFIRMADKALYNSKREGRNRSTLFKIENEQNNILALSQI